MSYKTFLGLSFFVLEIFVIGMIALYGIFQNFEISKQMYGIIFGSIALISINILCFLLVIFDDNERRR